MSAELTFRERFLAIVVPTGGQVVWVLLASLVVVILTQSRSLLESLGVNSGVLRTVSEQFHSHFDGILRSEFASQIAVITFWAVVGLIAYLICWGAYNLLVEARNEVTLNTVYTNRGHWRSPWHTLGLKAVAAIGLGLGVASMWNGITLWMAFVSSAITDPGPSSALLALLGWAGQAVHLYIIFALVQLTFTPWYRAGAFTES